MMLRLRSIRMSKLSPSRMMADCVAASKHVMAREYYKALMAARKLVDYEEQRLGNASGVQTGDDED